MRITSHKSPLWTVGMLVLAIAAGSCNNGAKTTADLSKSPSPNLNARKQVGDNPGQRSSVPAAAPQGEELYFGEDWDTGIRSPLATAANPKSKIQNPKSPADSQVQKDHTWSLVLGTFTDGDHVSAAQRMIASLQAIAPQVRGCRVHPTPRGSMVVYGHFTGRDDPNAVAEQERLKQLKHNGHPVFNRVLLTRLDLRIHNPQLHPHDLLSARREHPKVNPLYTLDIAIWVADESPSASAGDRSKRSAAEGAITYDEARRRAEAYAQELRNQGHQAYFYHDHELKQSVVTVGLFNSKALDHKTGFYSAEVDRLLQRFPVRLFNGEQLLEVKRHGTQPQKPLLVLVPGM